jgi:dolichol kinase
MSASLALTESQNLAEDLYNLLRTLDPARWRVELEPLVRERLSGIQARLQLLLEEVEWPTSFETLRERLLALRQVLQEASPTDATHWDELRLRLTPAYEAIAASLKVQSIHVPSLRPTNYTRNIFHVLSGLSVLMIFHHVFSQEQIVWVGGISAAMAWSMELGRRHSPALNRVLMGIFGKVAHPHERHRVNSSTWYTTALFLLAWLMPPVACSLAVIVLAVSDPAAALIGRRFGRIRVVAGRTLEGSVAFLGAGVLAALATLAVYYDLTFAQMLALALGGTAAGAVAEMVSERIDDNFSIPMSVACGATAALWALGL